MGLAASRVVLDTLRNNGSMRSARTANDLATSCHIDHYDPRNLGTILNGS